MMSIGFIFLLLCGGAAVLVLFALVAVFLLQEGKNKHE